MTTQVLPVPADGEWFDLEVDDDQDPMKIVVSAERDSHPKGWKYLGPKLAGRRVYRVKLIRFGHPNRNPSTDVNYARNLAEAKEKVGPGYRLLEGQAYRAFKAKYPRHDDGGGIVFGGSEWQSPGGVTYVVYLWPDQLALCWNLSLECFSDHCPWCGFKRWAVVSK